MRVGNLKIIPQEAAEGADNVKEEAGEPGLAFDADSIKVMVKAASEAAEDFPKSLFKVMAETIGMGLLPEEAARELAEEATYRHGNIFRLLAATFKSLRVRQLVQDSQKFMNHGKRHRLVAEDVDHALRVTGQEPLYGFRANEHIPFRCCQCGIG